MDPGAAPKRRPAGSEPSRIAEIVPARAVLTELARGFLMVQSGDPERAKQFASTFLREQVGRPSAGRIVPISRRPMVRRGLAALGHEAYAFSSGYVQEPSESEL